MPWLRVKITLDEGLIDFPIPDLELEVQRAGIPGDPGGVDVLMSIKLELHKIESLFKNVLYLIIERTTYS